MIVRQYGTGKLILALFYFTDRSKIVRHKKKHKTNNFTNPCNQAPIVCDWIKSETCKKNSKISNQHETLNVCVQNLINVIRQFAPYIYNSLPTTLVVQIKQSVLYVCVPV